MPYAAEDEPLDEGTQTVIDHQRQQARHHKPDDLLKQEEHQTGDEDGHYHRDRTGLPERVHRLGACPSRRRRRRARPHMVVESLTRTFTPILVFLVRRVENSERKRTTMTVLSTATTV